MDIKSVKAGPIETNCYVVMKDNACFIVDCGGNEVADFLSKNDIDDVTVLLTHGHYDHMMGIPFLREKIKKVKIYALEEEKQVILDDKKNCSELFGDSLTIDGVDYIKDGEILDILGYDIKVIHTPGHTEGSCCYYIEKEKVLFSGDTLFYHTSGRTDLPTGGIRQIIVSIGQKLMELPDDVNVYPGHKIITTIGEERKYNEIVRTYNMRKKWD